MKKNIEVEVTYEDAEGKLASTKLHGDLRPQDSRVKFVSDVVANGFRIDVGAHDSVRGMRKYVHIPPGRIVNIIYND